MNTTANEVSEMVGTYRLLARLWLREVDEQLIAGMQSPPLKDAFTAAGGILPADITPSTLDELAVDYCQLFLGPANHLPPVQSVWQRGQFQSELAESMQHYVTATGYELTDGLMFDHLGVQLDLMSHLLYLSAALNRPAEEIFDVLKTYFVKHLTWADSLFEIAINRASTDFYRSTIRMTRDFLQSDETVWNASQRHAG